MLNNPNWQKDKPSIFSNASFVAWLNKQPSGAQYNYRDGTYCLIAQYLKEAGVETAVVGSHEVIYRTRNFLGAQMPNSRPLPDGWDYVAKGDYAIDPHTYGEAQARAKAVLEIA